MCWRRHSIFANVFCSMFRTLLGLIFGLASASTPAWAQAAAQVPASGDPAGLTYPRHKFSAIAMPKSVASTWTMNGLDFNFRSSTIGFGLSYEFQATAQISIGLEYQHYDLKAEGGSVAPYTFDSSKAGYDVYLASFNYCINESGQFVQQICPGLVIGNDSYPVLKFHDPANNRLSLDRYQDLIVGLHFGYQSPVTDNLMFRARAGYLFGTGTGTSSTVTPKNSSSYFLRLGTAYEFTVRQALGTEVEFVNRTSTLRDKAGTNGSWATRSTDLGLRVSYILTL